MKKYAAVYICIIGLALLPRAMAHEGHHDTPESVTKPISGESIYNLKTKWSSSDEASVNLSSLRGHPVVAAMGYTSCESACPILVEDMKKIEMSLSEQGQTSVIFAFFSFDSARDTPARLRNFAAVHKVDLKHWRFFSGSPKSVRELAAVLGISYKKDAQGNFDHSNIVSLIDSNGVVRFQQAGLKQDPKEFQIKLLGLDETFRPANSQ